MLLDKPYFTIYLESKGCTGEFALNRQELAFEVGDPVEMELPVNHWIKEGENELRMILMPGKSRKNFNVRSNCSLTLRVRQSGTNPNTNFTIAKLSFSGDAANIGTGIEANSQADKINSTKDFISDRNGDIEIKAAEKDNYMDVAVVVSRKIILPKIGLPKWKWINGEKITGMSGVDIWGRMDKKTHSTIIKELLPIYRSVWDALKNRDVKSIIHLFEERSREIDVALYKKPGSTIKELMAEFEEAVIDPERKLWPITEDNVRPHVYDNDQLVRLQQNTTKPLVSFDYVGGGAEYYDFIFRKEEGKWYITR